MNEMTNTTGSGLVALDRLAGEARLLRASINMSMFQLARVFVEAKELVPHGEWGAWVEANADVSEKTASDMMAAYHRFYEKPQMQQIGSSKLFKMLALPAGTEDAFMAEHDVENMTVRQVAEAVKQARAEEQAKAKSAIEQERQRREEAEARARELREQPREIPEEVTAKLHQQEERIKEVEGDSRHFAELARKLGHENIALEQENKRLQQEQDQQQQDYDKLQAEFLNLKSAQKRGDANEPQDDDLSIGVFTAAVGEFMGRCARMPYMAEAFREMPKDEWRRYDMALRQMEDWLDGAKIALNSRALEGVVIDAQ